jgi:hypothetical protein
VHTGRHKQALGQSAWTGERDGAMQLTILRIALVFMLCLLFFDCHAQSALSHGVPPEERRALLAVYEATDGGHWKNHDGWLGPPGTECNWHGVLCEPGADEQDYLTDLNLSENNLSGKLPKEIDQLTQLQSLTLFGNHLSGKLPDPLIERWLAGSLDILAEAPLLTDISEIDFESSPTALLCGQRRIVLRADTTAISFTNRCRLATPKDRATYCQVKEGRVLWLGFAKLAWLIEKNGYFALLPKYERNITEGTFVSTRVTRAAKVYEVVDYAGGGPLNLWTIESAIAGVASSLDWEKTRTRPKCPAWHTVTWP